MRDGRCPDAGQRDEKTLLTLEAFFAGTELFDEMTSKQQRDACRFFTERTLVDEEAAFEQGEEGDCFYAIVSGKVAVLNNGILASGIHHRS